MIALGIDSGGSNTRLAFRRADGTVEIIRGARGNVAERGPGPVARTMVSLVKKGISRLGGEAEISELSALAGRLVVGAAGVGTAGLCSALEQKLGELLPNIGLTVVTDAELAMHTAFGRRAGLAIIVGTGTAMFMRGQDGSIICGGGWGPLAGDVGGGFWLGRHLLSHVADVYDGLAESDSVVEAFLQQEGVSDRASFKGWLRSAGRKRKAVAAIAPLVLNGLGRGEGWPCWLCSQAAKELGRLAHSMANGAEGQGSMCAVLVGGVVEGETAGSEKYRQIVAQCCSREADVKVVELPHRPVEGALLWAEEFTCGG